MRYRLCHKSSDTYLYKQHTHTTDENKKNGQEPRVLAVGLTSPVVDPAPAWMRALRISLRLLASRLISTRGLIGLNFGPALPSNESSNLLLHRVNQAAAATEQQQQC